MPLRLLQCRARRKVASFLVVRRLPMASARCHTRPMAASTELGEFLRARRARLRPSEVVFLLALARGGRRAAQGGTGGSRRPQHRLLHPAGARQGDQPEHRDPGRASARPAPERGGARAAHPGQPRRPAREAVQPVHDPEGTRQRAGPAGNGPSWPAYVQNRVHDILAADPRPSRCSPASRNGRSTGATQSGTCSAHTAARTLYPTGKPTALATVANLRARSITARTP